MQHLLQVICRKKSEIFPTVVDLKVQLVLGVPHMGNELLTTGQIARILGVHRTTVHHWEKAGKLTPFTVANGVRLFAAADVEAVAAERASK
jgi:hypothetical protein